MDLAFLFMVEGQVAQQIYSGALTTFCNFPRVCWLCYVIKWSGIELDATLYAFKLNVLLVISDVFRNLFCSSAMTYLMMMLDIIPNPPEVIVNCAGG